MELLPISKGLFYVAIVLAIQTFQAAGINHGVDHVQQNYDVKLNSQLVQQINAFSKSMVFYKAYASYFDRSDVNLPGFKKYFLTLSEEKRESAQNLTEIVNERGGYVSFSAVKLRQLCTILSKKLKRFPHVCFYVLSQTSKQRQFAASKFKKSPPGYFNVYQKFMSGNSHQATTPEMPTILSAAEDALALERRTNKGLIDLMDLAIQKVDPAMRVKLDDFLERQVDVIYNLGNIVTRLGFYHNTGNEALGEYILDSELAY